MPKPSAINVLLVRAGATSWDEQHRLAGSADLPLCEQGRERVRAMAGELCGERLSSVYCGSDEASIATAEAVAAKLGGRVRAVKALSELSLGLWEGMTPAQLAEKNPRAYRQWSEDPANVNPPEGESFADAQERIVGEVVRLLERARSEDEGVCFVLRPLAMAILRLALEQSPSERFAEHLADVPMCEWTTVWRDQLAQLRQRSRARTTGV